MTSKEQLLILRREVTRLAGLVEQLRCAFHPIPGSPGMHPVTVGRRLRELIERLELAEKEKPHDQQSDDSTRSVRGR